jgi:hypothetical protein
MSNEKNGCLFIPFVGVRVPIQPKNGVLREGFAQDFEADAVCAFPTRTLGAWSGKSKPQTARRLRKTARINCRF